MCEIVKHFPSDGRFTGNGILLISGPLPNSDAKSWGPPVGRGMRLVNCAEVAGLRHLLVV